MGLFGIFPPVAKTQLVFSDTDTDFSAVAGSTFSFAAKAIGAAVSNRVVAVVITARGTGTGATLSSATIGGSTATIAIQNRDQTTNQVIVAIIYLTVAAGTTATIAPTFSASMTWCAIDVYRIVGPTIGNTAIGNGNNPSLSISAPAGSVIIGGQSSSGGTLTAVTWTGLNKDSDRQPIANNVASSASKSFGYTQTSLSVSVADNNTATLSALAAAVFKP